MSNLVNLITRIVGLILPSMLCILLGYPAVPVVVAAPYFVAFPKHNQSKIDWKENNYTK